MRIVRNEAFIKQRIKFTQRGSLIGMGLLLASLLLSSRSLALSYLFLIIGFLTAMLAVRVGNRYVRPPRRDLLLDKLLKGLGNKYVLFHYMQPAEQLLLTPSGLIAILMREQQGQIRVRGKKWQQNPFTQKLRVLFGEAPLGDPGQELRRQLAMMGKVIQGLPGLDGSVPLIGLPDPIMPNPPIMPPKGAAPVFPPVAWPIQPCIMLPKPRIMPPKPPCGPHPPIIPPTGPCANAAVANVAANSKTTNPMPITSAIYLVIV